MNQDTGSTQQTTTPNPAFSPTPPDPAPQKKRKNIPAIVLSIIVVLLLGVIGWLVYDKLTATDAADTNNAQDTPTKISEKDEQTEVDPTEGWVATSNQAGKYSFKHPSKWTTEPAGAPEMCTPELTLLATSKENIAKCPGESFGQMAFDSVVGDKTSDYKLNYPNTTVTVDGVTGVRYEGEVTSTSQSAGIGPEDGTKEVLYVFYDGTRTYRAMYYQYPDAEDITEDFDVIVTKTLKFAN